MNMLLDLADVVTGQQEVTQIQQAAQNWCQLCHTMRFHSFQTEAEADNKAYSQWLDSNSLLALNLVGVEA